MTTTLHDHCSTQRLPWELTDSIIDQLQPDVQALGTCALVCSEWLKRSRHHGFSTVQLWPWRIQKFLELVASPNATVLGHIQRVELDESLLREDGTTTLNTTQSLDLLSPSLFPRLSSLQISNVDWTAFSPPEQAVLRQALAKFQRVSHLDFKNATFHDMKEVAAIAMSYPRLEHLTTNVRFMKYTDHAIASAMTLRLPDTLKCIDLTSDDAIPVATSCIASAALQDDPKLQSLTMRPVRMDHLPHIQRAIKRVGPSLRRLVLGFDHSWEEATSEEELLSTLKLSKLGRLRHLSFEGLHLKPAILEIILPRLLSRLQSPFLHTIDLAFVVDVATLEQSNLDPLQRILMEHHFFGLRQVNVWLHLTADEPAHPSHTTGAVEATFRSALHELDTRGVLQVAVLPKRPTSACSEVVGADVRKSL